jgi:glycosyltransferase involved in cell wall biosynthesis
MPSISVIITTFNRCALLQRAVESVKRQSLEDFETIIVNDGSTDETGAWLSGLGHRTAAVISFEKNRGGNVARNAGLATASGRWVAFLDDDDTWESNKLAAQIEAAVSLDDPVIYTGKSVDRSDGRPTGYSFKQPRFADHFRSIMYDNFIGVTSSVMARRDSVLGIGGFDERLPALQDYDLYIRLLKNRRAFGLPAPLVRYTHNDAGSRISTDADRFALAAGFMLDKYKSEPGIGLLRRALFTIGLRKACKSARYAALLLKNPKILFAPFLQRR